MASIPDSQSVSEPSVLEMRGTSITDSIQIESREIESQLNGIPKNKCKFLFDILSLVTQSVVFFFP